jgi:hypothetical protein
MNFGDAYTVSEQPKEMILRLPNNTGQIAFSSNVIENSINLLMRIDFKKSVYPPEYYPYLKEFMSKIVDVQKNSLIVLKKN